MSLNYKPYFESGRKDEFFAKVSELNGLKSPLYGLSVEALSKERREVYEKFSNTNIFLVSRVYSYKDGKHVDIVEFEKEVKSRVSKLKSKEAEFRVLYLFDFFEDYVLYHRASALDSVIRYTYGRKPNDTFIAIRILSEKDVDFLVDFIKMKNGEYGIHVNEKIIPVLAFDLVAKEYNTPEKLAEAILNIKERLDVPSLAFDSFSKHGKVSVVVSCISAPIPPTTTNFNIRDRNND